MDENKNPLKDSLDKSAIGLAVKLIDPGSMGEKPEANIY